MRANSPMLVSEYDQFVRESDQALSKPITERMDIAMYGLVGEIGSLVAAIKKKLLSEGGEERWNEANEEILEELGDAMWYCFSLSAAANPRVGRNIFSVDIANLKTEIGASDEKAKRIQAALDASKRDRFLVAANKFPRTKYMVFEDYQTLAFLTARTRNKVLLEVCLAVLWQLGAELLRRKLPVLEKEINRSVPDRDINRVLGEIAWHLAAVSTLHNLALSDIARSNETKVSYRRRRGMPTPLHDSRAPTTQQFPRRFEIAFLTVAKGRSRMYLDGRQLGAELTDNAYDEDGYRFHDVMHLANVAKLGWSPVIRDLMGRKRKYKAKLDEVEDGARARIVEEAVIKAIHSEGIRTARLRSPKIPASRLFLFAAREDITFRFLRSIHESVRGLEVFANRYWEWEDAIIEGYTVFASLRQEEQGTVTIDLKERTIVFRPDVFVDLHGSVAGVGSSSVSIAECEVAASGDLKRISSLAPNEVAKRPQLNIGPWLARVVAVKRALCEAIGMPAATNKELKMLSVLLLDEKRVSIKASGSVRKLIWSRGIISFKTTLGEANGCITCLAVAATDTRDALKK